MAARGAVSRATVRCWIERDFLRAGEWRSARQVYQSQSIRLQDPLNLAARMHRPGPGGIQLHVSLPVLERLARLTNLLKRQREIVVRISVGWSELQRRLVRLDRFLHPSSLIQNIPQVEVGKRVPRIGF